MIENGTAATLARKVPIDMVREVHYRSLVGACHVCYLQRVVIVEVETRLDIHLARVVLVSVGRYQREYHAICLHTALPQAVGKPFRAAVQVVDAVVDLKTVLHAVDRHTAARDTVRNTAHAFTAGRAVAEIAHRIHVSEHHVVDFAVAVGNLYRHDRSAYVA